MFLAEARLTIYRWLLVRAMLGSQSNVSIATVQGECIKSLSLRTEAQGNFDQETPHFVECNTRKVCVTWLLGLEVLMPQTLLIVIVIVIVK